MSAGTRLLSDLRKRKFLIPEVLQTSMMDCGPATLKSVFDGFGRPINLDRLRERCQTDVDGTSLRAMHEAGSRLGLDSSQVMLPKDSLLLPEAACLPAIVFVLNPDGLLHFVTVWRVFGDFVQIMDPARGRIWMRKRALLEVIATPPLTLPAKHWRTWAGGDDFAKPLLAKMRAVGVSEVEANALFEKARQDPTPKALATLDAATRMVRALIDSGAVPRGRAAAALLRDTFTEDSVAAEPSIPAPYWSCRPGGTATTVTAVGAVLLVIDGLKAEELQTVSAGDSEARATQMGQPKNLPNISVAPVDDDEGPTRIQGGQGTAPSIRRTTQGAIKVHSASVAASRLSTLGFMRGEAALGIRLSNLAVGGQDPGARQSIWAGAVVPSEVLSELRAPTVRPHRIFARMLWDDSKVAIIVTVVLTVLASGMGILDAVLMRGLSDTLGRLNLVGHRMIALVAVLAFLIIALLTELAQAGLVQRLARGLEARLRVAFLEKLPKLEDKYFRSRPVSDMASRAHLLQTLRNVPRFAIGLLSGVLSLVATTLAIVWLDPKLAKLAFSLLAVSLLVPVVSYRLLDESLARSRTHGAALYRFYLDALLGVVPIRVHSAERSVRREHEGLLTEWVRTARSVETRTVGIMAVERLLGAAIAAAIVVMFVKGGGDLRALLLVAFFAQRLPGQAEGLVKTMRGYPLLKHDALRLFEPLAASESGTPDVLAPRKKRGAVVGVDLLFDDVTAMAGGRALVSNAKVTIRKGTHIAIVGPSGAGKSSLVSILMGWLFVTEGRVLVDGRPLDAVRLAQLRNETAWVDPSIQLWNATLLENLLYGHSDDALVGVEDALVGGDLLDVVERMRLGLQSPLGEGGAQVSGGQGQRVRLGRALLRRNARLAILDEPFRGLERSKRREMLRRSRKIWQNATMLFVSHDVSDTLEMDRILVVDHGAIIEDGSPEELLARDSKYKKLVEGDRAALSGIWGKPEWRRLTIEHGALQEPILDEVGE